MHTNYSAEFDFAKETLLKASDIALTFFNSSFTSRLKADNTFVTEADEATEAFIRKELVQKFPDYGFIGEEGEADKKAISWIVDPIDGTSAFARGRAEFTLVLALIENDSVVLSLIYNPILKDLYHAQKGNGAYRNGTKISVSSISDLSLGTIAITGKSFHKPYSRDFAHSLADNYRLRIGYAGIESGLLAQGTIDALVEFDQHIWDVAPEVLLMTEAGAVVTDEFQNPLELQFTKDILINYIATTPLLSKKYADVLYFQKK